MHRPCRTDALAASSASDEMPRGIGSDCQVRAPRTRRHVRDTGNLPGGVGDVVVRVRPLSGTVDARCSRPSGSDCGQLTFHVRPRGVALAEPQHLPRIPPDALGVGRLDRHDRPHHRGPRDLRPGFLAHADQAVRLRSVPTCRQVDPTDLRPGLGDHDRAPQDRRRHARTVARFESISLSVWARGRGARHSHLHRAVAPADSKRYDQARCRRRAGPSVRGDTTVSLTWPSPLISTAETQGIGCCVPSVRSPRVPCRRATGRADSNPLVRRACCEPAVRRVRDRVPGWPTGTSP